MKTLFIAAVLTTAPALAHDRWDNGDPVPEFIKSSCCGVADFHRIPASAIHIMPDGFHIDGIETVVPMARVLPSPDGSYYGFWRNEAEPEPSIFCFFAPLNGT